MALVCDRSSERSRRTSSANSSATALTNVIPATTFAVRLSRVAVSISSRLTRGDGKTGLAQVDVFR